MTEVGQVMRSVKDDDNDEQRQQISLSLWKKRRWLNIHIHSVTLTNTNTPEEVRVIRSSSSLSNVSRLFNSCRPIDAMYEINRWEELRTSEPHHSSAVLGNENSGGGGNI